MARRSIPEVNAGSMADIAFLLLIFFLVTTTIESNSGITVKLPPKQPADAPPPPLVKERNVLVVIVNKNNQLLINNQIKELKDVKTTALVRGKEIHYHQTILIKHLSHCATTARHRIKRI